MLQDRLQEQLSAARQTLQQEHAEQQVNVDNLHQQLRDMTSQLSTSTANCERLSASVAQQSDRADELQHKLDHAESQLKNKVCLLL